MKIRALDSDVPRAADWVASDPSVLVDDRTTDTWPDETYHHGLLFKRSALPNGPKVVAGDRHVFAGVPETNLRLIGVRTWGGSDNVVLSYATSLE